METRRAALYSAVMHLVVLLLAYFGLPEWFDTETEPQPLVISLEMLPITDKTNVKPSRQPIVQEKKDPPKPTPEKKPTPPAAPPPPPPPPPPAPAPTPAPKKEPPKEQPKKPEPKPAKPDPVKASKPSEDQALEAVLKDLKAAAQEHDSDKKSAKDPAPAQNLTQSEAPYDPSLPLSLSERDAINSQFVRCWRVPAGSANDYTLKVSVDVELRADGSVVSAKLASEQRNRYASDTVFRAAADSAVRAMHLCSPLKNLPTDKYNSWKSMRLNFDPSMQLY